MTIDELAKLTPEQKRVKIAEACRLSQRIRIYQESPETQDWINRLPDYLNDLNACHEMEKMLTPEQLGLYCDRIINQDSVPFSYITATAAQRCDAFLLLL